MDAADIGNLINCYTFSSEPHAKESEVSIAMVEGIDTYKNRGFFHTNSGICVVKTTATNQYPNANLAYSQLNGDLQQKEGFTENSVRKSFQIVLFKQQNTTHQCYRQRSSLAPSFGCFGTIALQHGI